MNLIGYVHLPDARNTKQQCTQLRKELRGECTHDALPQTLTCSSAVLAGVLERGGEMAAPAAGCEATLAGGGSRGGRRPARALSDSLFMTVMTPLGRPTPS